MAITKLIKDLALLMAIIVLLAMIIKKTHFRKTLPNKIYFRENGTILVEKNNSSLLFYEYDIICQDTISVDTILYQDINQFESFLELYNNTEK